MPKKVEKGEPIPVGNERFEGFCKDLADKIAKELNISCKFEIPPLWINTSSVLKIKKKCFQFVSDGAINILL